MLKGKKIIIIFLSLLIICLLSFIAYRVITYKKIENRCKSYGSDFKLVNTEKFPKRNYYCCAEGKLEKCIFPSDNEDD